jgi:hypothetical protein
MTATREKGVTMSATTEQYSDTLSALECAQLGAEACIPGCC